MPCQIRLARLCDSRPPHRHATHTMIRALHSSASRLDLGSGIPIRTVQTTVSREHLAKESKARVLKEIRERKTKPVGEEWRKEALERLDRTIDPDDLSATLEAHRELNRTSVLRKVSSTREDPDVARPSFLSRRPLIQYEVGRVDSPRIQWLEVGRVNRLQEQAELGVTSPTQPDLQDDKDNVKLSQLQRVATSSDIEAHRWGRQHNIAKHRQRCDFLREHESPSLGEPPAEGQNRASFFEVIRRSSTVIRAEQKRLKRAGKVDIAEPAIVEYSGEPSRLRSMKGFPHLEPWARKPSKPFEAHQRLELEMKHFVEWMELTHTEEAARKNVSEGLLKLLEPDRPLWQAEVFGSSTTGLALPTSDIDIRVWDTTPVDPNQDVYSEEVRAARAEHAMAHMRKLSARLQDHPDWTDIVLQASRYPLVSAVHQPSGLKIQLVAARPTHASRQAISKYLAEYPTLKPLYILVKAMLDLRRLSDVWVGGFGSYSTFMMIVASLRLKSKPQDSMAQHLLDFLDFYGFQLDTYTQGISIEPPLIFPKKNPSQREIAAREHDQILYARIRIAQTKQYQRYLLALQDPADPFNDLGSRGSAIKDVQATFRRLHEQLKNESADKRRMGDDTPLIRKLVGRCDRYYDEFRTRVELYGSQFVEGESGELSVEQQQHGQISIPGQDGLGRILEQGVEEEKDEQMLEQENQDKSAQL